MFKKINIVVFIFTFSLIGGSAQVINNSKPDFLLSDQEEFEGFIERRSLDSAYRFLNKYSSSKVDYYLSWKTLAYSYWEKGDLGNSSVIAFWLKGKTNQFANPNEFYPQLHHLVGNIYFTQNQLDSAIVNYKRAIDYREKYTHPHDTLLIDTYQNISQVYSRISDSSNTFFYLEKAKDIVYLQSNNIVQIASIQARIADSYLRLAYYDLADRNYKEALDLLDPNAPEHQHELSFIFMQKGRSSYVLGKFTESIEMFSASLKFLDKINAPAFDRANVIEQIADVHYMLKDYENALQMYLKSNAIFDDLLPVNHERIISLHTDLASVYKGLEDYENAISHFRLAESNSKLSSYQYRVFGETLWKAKQLDKAEEMLKLANSEAESRAIVDKKEIADTHFWLGSFYLNTGRNKMEGLYYLNLAVGEYRSVLGDKNEPLGRALLALSKYFVQENDTEKALEIIQSSIIALTPGFYSKNPLINPDGLQLSIQSVANSLGWKAQALAHHFEKTNDLNHLRASFDTYQLSLKMVEGFRLTQKYGSNIILNKEVNNLLNQAIHVSHKLYTLTKELKYFEATFSFIEQNKSTALLASLQQNDSLRLSNVPTELIEKENKLKQDLLSLREKINPLADASLSDQKLNRVYEIRKNATQNSLDSLQYVLSVNHPEYYRLFYGNNVIGISDVQKQLKKNKVLIDYAITDSLLLVYVISKQKADLFTKKMPSGFNNSVQRLLQLMRYVNTENGNADFQSFIKLAYENYQFLLGDFADALKGKELLIVPDGILSYLPFDILLTDSVANEKPDYRNLPYFIRNNVSSTLNSAAIYFSYSQKKKPNYGQIIAFAPEYSFFDRSDTVARRESYTLLPLHHVKRELESISSFFNPRIFKGDNATKAKFRYYAPDASVLHLAMHAVLNDEKPMQSELIFSNEDDEFSSGLFTVSELFGMNLSADLAVLSACNSGNGKLNKGEGIMSLSTGFQYAGVPGVVMTHWDVNDKFGADLMAGFYAYLAHGLDKNIALHKAKTDIINHGSPIYSHPYYWAGFTLIGNESAIVSRKSGFGKSLEFALPILIILGFILRKKRKQNG